MKKGFRVLSLIVLIIGIVSFSRAWVKKQNDTEPMRSYVAVFSESETAPDGKVTINRWRTQYVKANGETRTVAHGADAEAAFKDDATAFQGTKSPVLAKTAEGFFVKPSGSNERKEGGRGISELDEKLYHSRSFLKTMPQFVRMDKVVGLDVYVARLANPDYPDDWTEVSHSPLTGVNPLRIVVHLPDGTLFTLEAVKIEFKDVPDNLNDDVLSLPDTRKLSGKTPPAKDQN
jgi:hypothetical protein